MLEFFIINALLGKKTPAHGQASFAAGWRLDMGLSKADTDVDIEQELLNWGPHGAANWSAKNFNLKDFTVRGQFTKYHCGLKQCQMQDAAKDGNCQKRLYVFIEKQWNERMRSVWRANYSAF